MVGHPLAMLTEIYIEALLIDAELANQDWDAAEIMERQATPPVPEIGGVVVYI